MLNVNVYKDIALRTGGDIYIGVVGPVRTGKSSFIKRFMELMILPMMEDGPEKERAVDELPLSASGTIVTTSEPKFIPKEAAVIHVDDEVSAKFRLIDCVGYMVNGADAVNEQHTERMVKTPWLDYEIPFSKAAEIGTYKVIHDHSQIGIVVTADGSFGELPRENYIEAEERTINELKKLKKPFVVILNSSKPYSDETVQMANNLSDKYKAKVIPLNCLQLKKEDALKVMETILNEFPIVEIEFKMPEWIDMLDEEHPLKKELIDYIFVLMQDINLINDLVDNDFKNDLDYINSISLKNVDMSSGSAKLVFEFDENCYYNILSELIGVEVKDEYDLIDIIRDFSISKMEYGKVSDAVSNVRVHGYGVVTPCKEEITLDEPALIRHGNKFGVKIHASSPSIHMIRADIETEIAPIVGSEEQAKDLIEYINNSKKDGKLWDTNIFGKSVEQLINDGMSNKVAMLNDECQKKLQDTMKKIVNDVNGGMVCIII